ncbi:hypothetical protein GZH46_02494, partial [Fragariocoptes setiger]
MNSDQIDPLLCKIESYEASKKRFTNHLILDPSLLQHDGQTDFETFWIDLFISEFLLADTSHDDLLFFVRKFNDQSNGTNQSLECFRKDSKKIPIGLQPTVALACKFLWPETVYLNFILQNFNYHVTCAICQPKTEDQMEVLHKHTVEVFASPSARHMCLDKAKNEKITYPDVYFTVENYKDFLSEISVVDGQVVSVELVAVNKRTSKAISLFVGSINHATLKKSFKSGRFLSGCALPSSSRPDDIEFLMVRGPGNVGKAELAITEFSSWSMRRAMFQNSHRRSLNQDDGQQYGLINVDYRELQVWPIRKKNFLSRNLNPYACLPVLKKAKNVLKHKRSMSEGTINRWDIQNSENIAIDDIKNIASESSATDTNIETTQADTNSLNQLRHASSRLIDSSSDTYDQNTSSGNRFVSNIRQAFYLC